MAELDTRKPYKLFHQSATIYFWVGAKINREGHASIDHLRFCEWRGLWRAGGVLCCRNGVEKRIFYASWKKETTWINFLLVVLFGDFFQLLHFSKNPHLNSCMSCRLVGKRGFWGISLSIKLDIISPVEKILRHILRANDTTDNPLLEEIWRWRWLRLCWAFKCTPCCDKIKVLLEGLCHWLSPQSETLS